MRPARLGGWWPAALLLLALALGITTVLLGVAATAAWAQL